MKTGYDCRYEGHLTFSRPLTFDETDELNAYLKSRHDGEEGAYGAHCDWALVGNTQLKHNGMEKSYEMANWLELLITHYFDEFGVTVDGAVREFQKDGSGAREIRVTGSRVTVLEGRWVFGGTELRQEPELPTVFNVIRDGEWLGDVEVLSSGEWVGDITQGNGPPSKRYATRDEAVAYVIASGR